MSEAPMPTQIHSRYCGHQQKGPFLSIKQSVVVALPHAINSLLYCKLCCFLCTSVCYDLNCMVPASFDLYQIDKFLKELFFKDHLYHNFSEDFTTVESPPGSRLSWYLRIRRLSTHATLSSFASSTRSCENSVS